MFRWTIVFFVVALLGAIFGFGKVAAGAAPIAQILFVIFLILSIASYLSDRKESTLQQ